MAKITGLQERISLPGMSILEADQIDLWFQPVYQTPTGVVLHHEVFVRWRDRQGQFHLPETFFPALTRLGLLPWLDRQVISKVIDRLAQEEFLNLSVNLSAASLSDRHLVEYVQQLLTQSQVEPGRLSFEILEQSAAYHFSDAVLLTKALKQLGCPVILDNFTGQDLSMQQCQELSIEMVKVDGQFLHLFSSPEGEDFGQYLLEMRPVLGSIIIKFIEESPLLDWVKDSGFNGVQGCYLNPPDSVPDSVAFKSQKNMGGLGDSLSLALPDAFLLSAAPAEARTTEPSLEPSIAPPIALREEPAVAPPKPRFSIPWLRLITGAGCVGLASLALTVGVSSLSYHFMHIAVDGGVLNGRTVRLQSPVKGNVTDFYAQPGAKVRSGQVLARIQQGREEEAALLLLDGEVQSKSNQLNAAMQTQAVLQTQASGLASRSESVWSFASQVSTTDLSGQRAALDGAIAQSNVARLNRDRYLGLAEAGAISRQVAEQYRAAWEVAEANVRQAQSALDTAEAEAEAAQSRTLMSQNPGLGNSFAQEASQIQQQIQTQASLVRTLTAERDNAQQRLTEARSIFSARQDLAVTAPFAGVVYQTERERNEQVEQSAPLLTLLDCNDLWVEIVLSAKEAGAIDVSKPVKVEMGDETVMGEVALRQPISSATEAQLRSTQVQALQSVIPAELTGQALMRLTIRIPPSAEQSQSQQFCGVGQLARLTFSKKLFSL
jgi:EAL domain-containing protein (putative c-di-GMP-specific phosphodiesterase class I)/multidrug resistance efflux pump